MSRLKEQMSQILCFVVLSPMSVSFFISFDCFTLPLEMLLTFFEWQAWNVIIFEAPLLIEASFYNLYPTDCLKALL